MARARNLKPGFFTNGDLLECRPLARLLYAGLWCEADRRGILEDRPKTLKVKILPGDDCDIEELLTELCDRGFIRRYEARGIRCICIPTFDKHQNPHVKEQASTLPTPDEIGKPDASPVLAPDKHSASPAESLLLNPESPILNPDTPLPPDAGGVRVRPSAKPDDSGFDEWYAIYPRHVAPAEARKVWVKLKPDERTAAMDAIGWQLPFFREQPPDKVPHPTTWLNQRRWEDDKSEYRTPPKPSTNGRHPPLPQVLQPGHVPPDGGLADYKRLYGGGSTAREAS